MRSTLFLAPLVLVASAALLPAACGDAGGTGSGGAAPGACTHEGKTCDVLCDDDLGCVACLNDADCDGDAPYCHLGHCDACESAADCGPDEACMPDKHACEDACASDDDCDGDAHCDPATGACLGCSGSADCPAEAPFCEPTSFQCSACLSDLDCGAATPKCELDRRECVGCVIDADCGEGAVCAGHDCKPCKAGQGACSD